MMTRHEKSERETLLHKQQTSSASGGEENDDVDEKIDSKTASIKDRDKQKPIQLKIYPQRWLMLAIFSLTTFLNGAVFMELSPVVAVVSPYYRISSMDIQWLSNMFLVVFIFVSLPSAYGISKYGVRPILSLAAILQTLSTLIQYFGSKQDAYVYVVIGQVFASIAYGNMLIIPGKLSATWFPPQERGMSTSTGVFMNIFGVAIGFVQPSYMIPVTNDKDSVFRGLKMFFVSRFIAAFLTLILTLVLYKENPPTPTSFVKQKEKLGFFESLKMLYNNYDFHLMAQAYAINFGLFVAVAIVFPEFVIWIYGAETRIQHLIGWMGFTCEIAAIVSCLVIGFYLDWYAGYKTVSVILNAGSAIFWLLFSTVLTTSKNFDLLFVIFVLYGTMGIPYFASGIEHAAEMTFPVPENTSSAVILLLGNLYGFIFMYVFGALIEYGYPWTTLHLILGLYVISTALAYFSKMKLKRTEAEIKSKSFESEKA